MQSPSMKLPPSGPPQGPNTGQLSFLLARQKVNEEILTYYAASLVALMAVFILSYWIRYAAARRVWNTSRFMFLYPLVALTRILRRGFLRQLSGFTSVGHAILVLIFVIINALFSFYRVDLSKSSNVASRFGWMATGNMALVVFLALKNTPLAFLTAYSYERLNSLHQIAGYTTLVYAILHGSIYTAYFIDSGKIFVLQQDIVTAGIILGFALLFTALAGLILRRFKYEIFYIAHLALFVVIVVALGLHRPSFEPDKTLIVTVLIASLWFSDRLIRLGRLAYNSINNKATVYPLPDGGTRIVLKKPLSRARPGKHCYVWLPHIRTFETHPFTIVASEPMELIINTYSGFTRDLHRYANEKPGASLTVSIEGPYGTLPDPIDYDKVVLVAGGSGATFTFGIALDMIRKMTPDSKKQIEFIWTTRGHDNMVWFMQHLNHLITHEYAPKIALKLHLTRCATTETTLSAIPRSLSQTSTKLPSTSISIQEKNGDSPSLSTQASSVILREKDLEEAGTRKSLHGTEQSLSIGDFSHLPVIYGRPDIEVLVKEAIASVAKDQRVLIAACGPTGLINTVRNTTAGCIRVDGPAVELHCEQFGW
ncbi:ferric reductase NAD binding domain-containing protein [Xylariaceae sp. FL1651]|nr:ferric reductase NAD binding domain-containing protein [Xylariaceae sp. FL1651]